MARGSEMLAGGLRAVKRSRFAKEVLASRCLCGLLSLTRCGLPTLKELKRGSGGGRSQSGPGCGVAQGRWRGPLQQENPRAGDCNQCGAGRSVTGPGLQQENPRAGDCNAAGREKPREILAVATGESPCRGLQRLATETTSPAVWLLATGESPCRGLQLPIVTFQNAPRFPLQQENPRAGDCNRRCEIHA